MRRRSMPRHQGPSPNHLAPPNPLPLPPTPASSPQAVKAMRYGEGGGAVQEFEDATALRERQEQELAAALEEEDEF